MNRSENGRECLAHRVRLNGRYQSRSLLKVTNMNIATQTLVEKQVYDSLPEDLDPRAQDMRPMTVNLLHLHSSASTGRGVRALRGAVR